MRHSKLSTTSKNSFACDFAPLGEGAKVDVLVFRGSHSGMKATIIAIACCISIMAVGQNIGIQTTNPEAKLHVNGTFKLEHGVIVNGISNDTTLSPGSDSLLVTQLAIKKYMNSSLMIPDTGYPDSSENRTLTLAPDSMLYHTSEVWQSDSALNVYTVQGNVGMGVTNPTAKLHINGSQKIVGAHTLTLGTHDSTAAKFGYGMLTPDALDIIGAGPAGNKKIKFWHELFATLSGVSTVADTARLQSAEFYSYVRSNGNVGIGIQNPSDALEVKGTVRISGGNIGPRIRMQGNAGDFTLRSVHQGYCHGNTGWPLYFRLGSLRIVHASNIIQFTNSYADYSPPAFDGMDVRGNMLTTGPVIAQNGMSTGGGHYIEGNHVLEMGAFVPGKEVNAGKIGYETFTPGALDIVGAGTTNTNRKIKCWAEGGLTANGDVNINGTFSAVALYSEPWTELTTLLQNNWSNYSNGYSTIAMYKDPEGIVHLRGLIKDGLNVQNTVIVTLPTGYRPALGHQIFQVINGVNTFGRIDVESDGDVVFRGITNTFISLDQISFKTF